MSTSLDGFIAEPNEQPDNGLGDGGERLHEWVFERGSSRPSGVNGQVWDEAMLERFLADPEEMFPGLWMGNNGLRAAEDRAAVAAFLRTTK